MSYPKPPNEHRESWTCSPHLPPTSRRGADTYTGSEPSNISDSYHSFIRLPGSIYPALLWMGLSLHRTKMTPVSGGPSQFIKAGRKTNTTISPSVGLQTGSTGNAQELLAPVPVGDTAGRLMPTTSSGTQPGSPLIYHPLIPS